MIKSLKGHVCLIDLATKAVLDERIQATEKSELWSSVDHLFSEMLEIIEVADVQGNLTGSKDPQYFKGKVSEARNWISAIFDENQSSDKESVKARAPEHYYSALFQVGSAVR